MFALNINMRGLISEPINGIPDFFSVGFLGMFQIQPKQWYRCLDLLLPKTYKQRDCALPKRGLPAGHCDARR
jgi:hypothetical protein